jgi:hypothetical protein
MRLRNFCLAAVVSAFSLPAAVGAQPSAEGSRLDAAAFNLIDLDQDGFITREEARGTVLENRFDQLDVNHDGKLSPSEAGAR